MNKSCIALHVYKAMLLQLGRADSVLVSETKHLHLVHACPSKPHLDLADPSSFTEAAMDIILRKALMFIFHYFPCCCYTYSLFQLLLAVGHDFTGLSTCA